MRTIIAGSREGVKYEQVKAGMESLGWIPSVVISGTARGVDRMGERWAAEKGIPVERYPAEWDLYGKAAGFIRNDKMASVANALVAFWDGHSRGTKHMISSATRAGIAVFIYKI